MAAHSCHIPQLDIDSAHRFGQRHLLQLDDFGVLMNRQEGLGIGHLR